MKRIVCIAAAMLLLTGCMTVHAYINDIDAETVQSISFYELGEYVDVTTEGQGFENRQEPIYTLEQSEHKAFLEELSTIRYEDSVWMIGPSDPSFTYGRLVVRINFTDGGYRLISYAHYGATFDAAGELVTYDHYGCDEETFVRLISRYIAEE